MPFLLGIMLLNSHLIFFHPLSYLSYIVCTLYILKFLSINSPDFPYLCFSSVSPQFPASSYRFQHFPCYDLWYDLWYFLWYFPTYLFIWLISNPLKYKIPRDLISLLNNACIQLFSALRRNMQAFPNILMPYCSVPAIFILTYSLISFTQLSQPTLELFNVKS